MPIGDSVCAQTCLPRSDRFARHRRSPQQWALLLQKYKSINLYLDAVRKDELVLFTGRVEPVSGSVHRLRHRFVNSFTPPVRTNQVRFERAVREGRIGWGRGSVQAEVDANDSNVVR